MPLCSARLAPSHSPPSITSGTSTYFVKYTPALANSTRSARSAKYMNTSAATVKTIKNSIS